MNPGLDNLCRQIFAVMKADTPEELQRALLYVCRKTFASKMRRSGFKFMPVLKHDDNPITLRKVDYELNLNVSDKKLQIEILLLQR